MRENFATFLGILEPPFGALDFRGGSALCATIRTSCVGPFAALQRGKLIRSSS